MPTNIVEIGTTPVEEDCAATGITKDSTTFSRLECRAYIQALTRVYGVPPEGSRFTIPASLHDFGTYHEVSFRYNRSEAAEADYADKVENGLARWAEAEMWAPVMYDRHSQPIHVIDTLELLDRDANPEAKNAAGVARPKQLAET